MKSTVVKLPLFAMLALPRIAHAQTAPWGDARAPETTSSAATSPPAPPAAPTETTHSAAHTDPNDHYASTPDPAFTHNFQMPTARPLHHGDTMVTVMGDTGWVGVRYGFARRFDAGIGVPYYAAGVSIDARYAIILGEHAALSLFGYATIPFDPGGRDPTAFFGFNWHGAGPAWLFGPVVSLWGARAGIHLGAHASQRVLMGGLWAFVHLTVEARIVDSVRAIVQGVVMAEMIDEQNPGMSRALIGNAQPRVHPYVVVGARVHSRRFAVDLGALVSFASDAPLAAGTPGIWPWASVSHTF